MADLRLSTAELIALRIDLGRERQVRMKQAADLAVGMDEITEELRERQGQKWDVSDHAIVRYLQRVRGVDMDAIRAEIVREVDGVTDRVKVKGEAVGIQVGDHVYVVARGNMIVTVYPARPWEKPWTAPEQ